MELGYEHVMDGFFIHSLLMQAKEDGTYLETPEEGEVHLRLRPALEARNKRVVGFGRDMWNHACDSCYKVKTLSNGMPGN